MRRLHHIYLMNAKQSYVGLLCKRCSVQAHCLIIILECSVQPIVQ